MSSRLLCIIIIMDLIVTPDALVDIIKVLTDGLLERRFERKAKNYDKIDFKMIEDGDEYLCIQLTKCSSGYPNLKFLLTDAMKKQLNSKIIKKRKTVAYLVTKSPKTIRLQKVVCSRKSSFSLIDDNQTKQTEEKEFHALKHYISIKLLIKIKATNWRIFASQLMCYIMNIEQIHANVKFLFRKEGKQKITYIYRNKVKMDDIILSCKILSRSCEKIFRTSQDSMFQNDLMNKLALQKREAFKHTLGYLLYAQANNNFNCSIIT